jgi:hypothetical protein
MRDWKFIVKLLALALILLVAAHYLFPHVSAYYYVQQGDVVFTNETIDVSGVIPPYQYLAYWDGFDMYDSNATYQIDTSQWTNSQYYKFWLNPAIFSSRQGRWYRYNGVFERAGNNLAFVVTVAKPIQFNSSSNITLQNPNQTPLVLPKQVVLPVRHISDYLIARGDGFNITVNGSTNVWIFGVRDNLMDQQSFNGSVDITPHAINELSPGSYKILLQSIQNDTGLSAVRYDNTTGNIQWFDPGTFTIQGFSVVDQTPENILKKLEEIFPLVHDTYMLFNLEIQDPTITIDTIEALNQVNNTGAPQEQGVTIGSQNYVDVRGYTNVAPDTIIKVIVDGDFNQPKEVTWKNAIITQAQGTLGGDMREFEVLVPLKLYNMAPGRHFISAKTALSNETVSTADFYIYDNPTGNVIPNKTIRYISGRYGQDEIVPTPTPITVVQTVTIPVTVTVTIPVTPPPSEVEDAQRVVAQEQEQHYIYIAEGAVVLTAIIVAVILFVRFMFRAYKRKRWIRK